MPARLGCTSPIADLNAIVRSYGLEKVFDGEVPGEFKVVKELDNAISKKVALDQIADPPHANNAPPTHPRLLSLLEVGMNRRRSAMVHAPAGLGKPCPSTAAYRA